MYKVRSNDRLTRTAEPDIYSIYTSGDSETKSYSAEKLTRKKRIMNGLKKIDEFGEKHAKGILVAGGIASAILTGVAAVPNIGYTFREPSSQLLNTAVIEFNKYLFPLSWKAGEFVSDPHLIGGIVTCETGNTARAITSNLVQNLPYYLIPSYPGLTLNIEKGIKKGVNYLRREKK